MKYGLAGAGLAVMLLIILYYANKHPLLVPVIYDYRILLFAILIFFSIKEFKDYYNAKTLHFWQGMAIGLTCYVTVALVAAIAVYIIGLMEPLFLSSYISTMTRQLQDNKDLFVESISAEVYDDALKNLPSTTMSDLAVDYFLKSMPIGLFLTIIISVILRKQPKP